MERHEGGGSGAPCDTHQETCFFAVEVTTFVQLWRSKGVSGFEWCVKRCGRLLKSYLAPRMGRWCEVNEVKEGDEEHFFLFFCSRHAALHLCDKSCGTLPLSRTNMSVIRVQSSWKWFYTSFCLMDHISQGRIGQNEIFVSLLQQKTVHNLIQRSIATPLVSPRRSPTIQPPVNGMVTPS